MNGLIPTYDIITPFIIPINAPVNNVITIATGMGNPIFCIKTPTNIPEKPNKEFLENFLNGNQENFETPENSLVSHREIQIPIGSSIDGISIRELDFPEDCVIVKIIRGRKIILPRGDTLIKVGDIVEIFGMKENLARAELLLTE